MRSFERFDKHGAQLVGDVMQYQVLYRLCYIRGPEGLRIGLAEELKTGGTTRKTP